MSKRTEALRLVSDISGAPYVFGNGPEQVATKEEAVNKGLNCQAFTHLFYKNVLHNPLPKGFLSKEIYGDQELLRSVSGEEALQFGDILLFGKENEWDPRRFHLTVYIGGTLVAHSTKNTTQTPGVEVWDIQDFSKHKNYKTLYAVKRLKK